MGAAAGWDAAVICAGAGVAGAGAAAAGAGATAAGPDAAADIPLLPALAPASASSAAVSSGAEMITLRVASSILLFLLFNGDGNPLVRVDPGGINLRLL